MSEKVYVIQSDKFEYGWISYFDFDKRIEVDELQDFEGNILKDVYLSGWCIISKDEYESIKNHEFNKSDFEIRYEEDYYELIHKVVVQNKDTLISKDKWVSLFK